MAQERQGLGFVQSSIWQHGNKYGFRLTVTEDNKPKLCFLKNFPREERVSHRKKVNRDADVQHWQKCPCLGRQYTCSPSEFLCEQPANGAQHESPEELVWLILNIFFDYTQGRAMYQVHRKQMQLHFAYVHRDSHIHSPGRKHGSAGDAGVPLPPVFPNSCGLLPTDRKPLTLHFTQCNALVWETCTWSRGESTICQWHRVLASLQFYWSTTSFKWNAVPGCWSSCWKVLTCKSWSLMSWIHFSR